MNIPLCAKGNHIISPSAGKYTRGIIIGIAIRFWTSRFEELRVVRWLASHGVAVDAAAAVLVGVEHVAGAAAPHSPFAGAEGELGGAARAEVAVAARRAAVAAPVDRDDGHGQVEAVDEADVVEVGRGEGELGQRGRGLPRGRALEGIAACARLARASAAAVEAAPRAAPYPAAPRDRGREDGGLPLL